MNNCKRLLILDDDPDNAKVLEMLLNDMGYVSKSITTHFNLLDVIQSFNPQLILIDVKLQGVSGKSICFQLKTSPNFSHIPIILMSANSKGHDMKDNDCNADGFIEKPYDIYELNVMIARCILP